MAKDDCTCNLPKGRRFATNLVAREVRFTRYEDRDYLVVPVVMARSDVVMNEALLPLEELHPDSWNGVPVTINHPVENGEFISANSPDIWAKWKIGQVFNAQLDGPSLKGEAWIDIDRANKLAPGLVEALLDGRPMDVSTGYFSKDVSADGEINGRTYKVVNRDVKPNHLALLPDSEGACSWQDGCGVRNNWRHKMKLSRKEKAAIETLKSTLQNDASNRALVLNCLFGNERGDDDDHRQIVADLISNDDSPFTPDDEDSLRMMSGETLRKMRDAYLKKQEEDEEESTEEESTEEGEKVTDSEDSEDNKMKDNVAKLVAAAVDKAIKAHLKALDPKQLAKDLAPHLLSEEDRAAIRLANNQVKNRRNQLIERIVSNSSMDRKVIEQWSTDQLETIADGLLPTPVYSARARTLVDHDNEDEVIAAMAPVSTLAVFKKQREGRKTA
jgi:hypothetical protein